jgi:hypothetical protein
MELPSQQILEQAWSLIKHLSSGPGPCNSTVSHECRQMVIQDNIDKGRSNIDESKDSNPFKKK